LADSGVPELISDGGLERTGEVVGQKGLYSSRRRIALERISPGEHRLPRSLTSSMEVRILQRPDALKTAISFLFGLFRGRKKLTGG